MNILKVSNSTPLEIKIKKKPKNFFATTQKKIAFCNLWQNCQRDYIF